METNKTYTREEVTEIVIELFKTSMQQTNDVITEHSIITEAFPDMDHLDRIDIISDLEILFIIVLKDEDIVYPQEENDYSFNFKLKTIKEFVDLILQKLNVKAGKLNIEME